MTTSTPQLTGTPIPNAPPTRCVYQFPLKTAIDSIHERPNGHLLLSTLNSGDFLTLDLYAVSPTPKTTLALFIVQIVVGAANRDHGVVLDRIPVNATLNGMASLPTKPKEGILVGDSTRGIAGVVRVNTRTREVDIAINDPALGTDQNGPPIEINGSKIQGGYPILH
ncbi:hypothetical protein HYFRA_00002345 [Hymenoscyphus fraxineus]|uniref:Uncharacterized protein n=1 Tax=Hymenoscyphus fraxineus TaxID=746836 RepID=A0A9N9LA91_9HELO|nr:hypothetical protein HYFRA_00002345 [Hymenoscyphus fraxineus]